MLCCETILKRGVEKTGRRLIPTRAGVTSEGVNNRYRAKCHYCGTCGRGCDVGAMFNSPTALLAPAEEKKRLTVRPDSVVREVVVGRDTDKAARVGFFS